MCYLLSDYFHFIMINNRTGQRVVEAQGIAAYYLVGIYWIENDVGGMSRWAADCISMTAWFSRHYPFVSCFQHRPQYGTVITFFPHTNFQSQNIPIQNPNKMKQLALTLLLYQIETGSSFSCIFSHNLRKTRRLFWLLDLHLSLRVYSIYILVTQKYFVSIALLQITFIFKNIRLVFLMRCIPSTSRPNQRNFKAWNCDIH